MMLQGQSAKLVRLSLLAVAITGCAKSEYPMNRQNRLGMEPIEDSRVVNAPLADPPTILPETHLAAGRLFEQQGLFGKAIAQYRKAVAVSHDNVPAHYRLGLALSRVGQHDAAIEALRRAVELAGKNAVLHNDLGFELMFRNKWAEAEAEFRRAIDLDPTLARAEVNLGLALSKQSRFDEALDAFRAVLPEPDAYYNLGLMYRAQRRYADAEQAFRHVLALAPKFTAATAQLDQMAARTNEPAPAAALAEAALREEPAQRSAPDASAHTNATKHRPVSVAAVASDDDAPVGPVSLADPVAVDAASSVDDALPCPDADETDEDAEADGQVASAAAESLKPAAAAPTIGPSDRWSQWRDRWNGLAVALNVIRDEIECLDVMDAEHELLLASPIKPLAETETDSDARLVKDGMTPRVNTNSPAENHDHHETTSDPVRLGKDAVGRAKTPVVESEKVAAAGDQAGHEVFGPPAELAKLASPNRDEMADLPRRPDHVGPVPH